MKINLLLAGMLLCTSATYAQNMFSMASIHPADTLRSESHEQAIRFSSLRQASVTATIFGSNKFTAKLKESELASGKSRNARISSYFTIPITSWDSNTFGASIYHTENFFDVREVNNQLANPRINTGNTAKSTLGLSLNFSRTDAIFHTPVIYSVVVTGISDDLKAIRRFNFNGSIVFPLKRTPDTYLSIGALVQIDPSAPIPVIPVINYFHKFNDSGLQLIVDLPQGASIKQALSKKAWVYLGSSYNTYVSFFKAEGQALPDRFSYNTIEFKSGPGFEYLLGKYVILGINGGINSIVSGRSIAKGDNYGDSFIKTTHRSTGYGEFRISVLPF